MTQGSTGAGWTVASTGFWTGFWTGAWTVAWPGFGARGVRPT